MMLSCKYNVTIMDNTMIYLNEYYISDEVKEITITYSTSALKDDQIGEILDFVIDCFNGAKKRRDDEGRTREPSINEA